MSDWKWYLPSPVREIRHHQDEAEKRDRERGSQKLNPAKPPRCSFCYRGEDEVTPVWPSAGGSTAICGDCIVRGYERLKELRLR